MSVNSLSKTVTRQRRGCDLNPGPCAPESSTLTTRLPSHLVAGESIFKQDGGRDALSPADKSAAPSCCSVCCLHSLMHFNRGYSPPPTKNCPNFCGSATPPNAWLFGSTGVHNPNGISVRSAILLRSVLCPSDRQTDRQTDRHADHATSVASIHLQQKVA